MEITECGDGPTLVVLDTNVVLDWLVFRDPSATPLANAIESGALRWISCARMRDELVRALGYPALDKWNPDSERTLTFYDQWSWPRPTPATAPSTPVCTDPDDQIFIDLALAEGSRWLLTRDRALLKLARAARRRGLRIATPSQWARAAFAQAKGAAEAAPF